MNRRYRPQGQSLRCDAMRCDAVLARGDVMLLRDPALAYPKLRTAEPPIVETLLAPWEVEGKPAGTVWVVSHGPARRFDAEDAR